VGARRRRRRGKERHDQSSVARFLVFLFVSALVVLILDYDTDRSMGSVLAGSGPQAPAALAVTEKTPASGKGTNEEPRTALPPQLPASGPAEESCDDARVLVDRSHPLPPDYAPEDLVTLRSYGLPTLGSDEMWLRREAAERLRAMASAAAADGEELIVASAYRSYEDQQALFARLSVVYGTEADLTSARPGHSQHQLGTAVDFTNAAAGYEVWERFGQTSAYPWLLDHAHEHGFVLAYPRDKEAETGYEWEPWHYRYVGVEDAERIAEGGLSLQEFLVREGVVPHC
jgi:D-alanyl-D-alanine carboxypeptidase